MTERLDRTRQRRLSLRSAAGRVEQSLASPTSDRVPVWSAQLARDLDLLGEALETHIEVNEAQGGLFDDIIEIAPRLAHRVDRVRTDHDVLREHFARARAALPCDADGVEGVRDATVELLTALVRHRHLGSELVYEAFNVDLEAAD